MSKRTSYSSPTEFTKSKKRKESDHVVIDLIDFPPINNYLRERFTNTQRSKLLWMHNLKALQGRYYLPIEFRNEKSFLLELFQSCGYMDQSFMDIFCLVSKDLANDKEVVIAGMEVCSDCFNFASEELKNDLEFLIQIRDSFGNYCLQYASQEANNVLSLMDLPEVGEKRSDIEFFTNIPSQFLDDKPQLLKLLEESKNNRGHVITDKIMHSLDKKLLNDKDFMLDSIEIEGYSLKFASDELKKDREFLKKAFAQSNHVPIEYVSDELKNDKEFIIQILKESKNSLIFKDLPLEMKNDREIVLEGVRRQFFVFDYIPTQFLNDKQIILECLKNPVGGVLFKKISEELKQDREILLAAVKNQGHNLSYVPKHLWDKEIVLAAVRQDYGVVNDIPIEFHNDSEIFLEFLKCHTYIINAGTHYEDSSDLHERLRSWGLTIGSELILNRDFIIKCLDYCDIIHCIPSSDLNHDREFILRIIKETKVADRGITLASQELLADRSFILTAVRLNGLVLKWLPHNLQIDPEIEEEAVKQAGIVLNLDRKDELYAIRMRSCYPEL